MTDPVRVLVVDDQPPFRETVRMVVELTDGFEVVGEAASGEEAVEVVDRLEPDLVLMDLAMPGIDGIEAARRIRAAHAPVRVIVMLSTYDPAEHRVRAAAAGADAFLSKSDFDPDLLLATWQDTAALHP
jgi:DNA-binding NarL/FixJ family response regulator